MLSNRLKRRGYEVISASDGESGIVLAQSERPALILMDLSLPVMDGWEATRRLKAANGTKSHPDHRAFGPFDGGRPREGARRGLRRVRHQAGRAAAPPREDRRPPRPLDAQSLSTGGGRAGESALEIAIFHPCSTSAFAARASTISRTSMSTCRATAWWCITGLSGSGKSSLAFDTIYAEGQRRYVESLSAYARQFLELMQKPDVDLDRGPVAGHLDRAEDHVAQSALDRRHGHRDLRLHAPALSRASACPIRRRPACRSKARPCRRWSTACWRCRKARGSICWRRSCAAARANTARSWPICRSAAFSASRSTASCYEIDAAPALDKKLKHDIEVVVDRIVVRDGLGQPARRHCSRPRSSSPTASPSPRTPTAASAPSSRPSSPARSRASPSPRSSRACSPSTTRYGACPACDGLGTKLFFDPELVVPDERLSLARGRDRAVGQFELAILRADARQPRAALQDQHRRRRGRICRRSVRNAILFGSGGDARRDEIRRRRRAYTTTRPFEGVIPNMERRWRETDSAWVQRGAGPLPERRAVRDLPRPPPQARGAGRQDRQARHQPGQRILDLDGGELVRRARRTS